MEEVLQRGKGERVRETVEGDTERVREEKQKRRQLKKQKEKQLNYRLKVKKKKRAVEKWLLVAMSLRIYLCFGNRRSSHNMRTKRV